MKPTAPSVLTVNGGSSSIKFALFASDGTQRRILEGRIEGIGLRQATFKAKGLESTDNFSKPVDAHDHVVAANVLMDWVKMRLDKSGMVAIGHRVVQGGPKYWEPQRITLEMIRDLHQPMSTRSGDLDPGLVWFLAGTEKLPAKDWNELVNFQSGLLGVSEISSDVRELLAHEAEDNRA